MTGPAQVLASAEEALQDLLRLEPSELATLEDRSVKKLKALSQRATLLSGLARVHRIAAIPFLIHIDFSDEGDAYTIMLSAGDLRNFVVRDVAVLPPGASEAARVAKLFGVDPDELAAEARASTAIGPLRSRVWAGLQRIWDALHDAPVDLFGGDIQVVPRLVEQGQTQKTPALQMP